jgi:AraC-like DNA-binding protein
VAALYENVRALPEFARSEQFRHLATAFKRVRNIAREYATEAFEADEASGEPLAGLLVEPAEQALLAEIEARRVAIDRVVADGRGFRDAYGEAARFEPVVARFFDEVFVMSDDLRLRQGRLRLMKRLEEILDSTRREMATAYLRRGLALPEVSDLLGYSDTTAFHHAFRRWTGQSPAAYVGAASVAVDERQNPDGSRQP